MQSINVLTSQNVNISYPIASLGDRILAYLVDVIIMFAYGFIALMGLIAINTDSIWLMVLFYLPIVLYHFIFELFLEGQSPGKRARNIKVIKLDGSRPSLGSYLIRWLLRPIDISVSYGGVAILSILLTGKGQRLGDLAGGTAVIKLNSTDKIGSNPVNQVFDEGHEVVFSEADRLSDSDIDLIDQVLKFNVAEANDGPANLLAEKLAAKMGVSLNMPPIKFLYTIKKDYLKITSH